LLHADLTRAFGRHSLPLLLRGLVLERTLRPVLTLRLAQCASGFPQPWRFVVFTALRVLHALAQHAAGLDLPWQVAVGAGLKVTHGWGLVVSSRAKIGNNVTLFHGVTIGQKDRILADGSRLSGFPTIGNNVWIGPHAIVIGQVSIGDGAIVGGGTVVTEDVAAGCVVVGNPMRVVRRDAVPDVMNPADIGAS